MLVKVTDYPVRTVYHILIRRSPDSRGLVRGGKIVVPQDEERTSLAAVRSSTTS